MTNVASINTVAILPNIGAVIGPVDRECAVHARNMPMMIATGKSARECDHPEAWPGSTKRKCEDEQETPDTPRHNHHAKGECTSAAGPGECTQPVAARRVFGLCMAASPRTRQAARSPANSRVASAPGVFVLRGRPTSQRHHHARRNCTFVQAVKNQCTRRFDGVSRWVCE